MALTLMNQRTGDSVATDVELAVTRTSRRRGLLGRDCLDASAALILEPCAAVHTAFMRFSIDVVFVNRSGYAVKIVEDLTPWRIAVATQAHAVIEMAAGTLKRHDISLGDRLYVSPAAEGETFPMACVERKVV
jgi:uncharacterized membrane protein (UPF0127 family)